MLRRHSTDPEARKRGTVGNQRSLDASFDSTHHNRLYLFRDTRDSKSGSVSIKTIFCIKKSITMTNLLLNDEQKFHSQI